ncbi:helix-turn-helix domain-containing protein [bacterium]|nr:helix-turn-helix domain-containing protein [bacterium]
MTEVDPLLTLREVALISDTPVRTLKSWTDDRTPGLSHEHVGRGRHRRVPLSAVMQFFGVRSLDFARLVHVLDPERLETIRTALNRYQSIHVDTK